MASPEDRDRGVGRGGHRAGGDARGRARARLGYASYTRANWLTPVIGAHLAVATDGAF